MLTRRKERVRSWGQSTLELAMLLPIVAFLLYMTIQGFGANHKASHESIETHANVLKTFDHGRGTILLPDGTELAPGEFAELIPVAPGMDLLGDLALGAVEQAVNVGLNYAFNNISFLSGDTWYGGATKGALLAGVNSMADANYTDIDANELMEDMVWGAGAGALASQDATEFFQGEKWGTGGNFQEVVGSGVQNAGLGYTQSQGDSNAALAGLASGMLNSDTSQNWFENGDQDILKGALKGAVQGSVSGVSTGEFDLKSIAISTGMGAFNTNTVASYVPGSGWGGDPKNSASFSATSAALGTVINGGNATDALYSATSGALFSGQSMNHLAGDSQYAAAGIGAVYGAGVAWIEGESAEQIATNALMSAGMGVISAKTAQWQNDLTQSLSNLETGEQVGDHLNQDETIQKTTEANADVVDESTDVVLGAITESDPRFVGPKNGPS